MRWRRVEKANMQSWWLGYKVFAVWWKSCGLRGLGMGLRVLVWRLVVTVARLFRGRVRRPCGGSRRGSLGIEEEDTCCNVESRARRVRLGKIHIERLRELMILLAHALVR